MHRIQDDERRRRLATRHFLASGRRATGLATAAEALVGLHSTDPGSVYLGAFSRVEGLTAADVARALYEERSLIKILGMRRTMFTVTPELAGLIHSAVTREIGAAERKRLLAWLARGNVADDVARWLSIVEAKTVAALEELGTATGAQLSERVPELRTKLPFGEGRQWQGTVALSTRMFYLLSSDGRIVRARPQGTSLSTIYSWSLVDRWVDGGLPDWPVDQAQAELVRRWLGAFGPGTERDIAWWTGWTLRDTRRALTACGAEKVELVGTAGYVLAGDAGDTDAVAPWVALLPGLDTTTMGWQQRGWYLGEHGEAVFDGVGNAGPTVWVDGRIVGGWAQRPSGEVVYRLLEDVGREAENALDERSAGVGAWLGDWRISPRARRRSPVERELVA